MRTSSNSPSTLFVVDDDPDFRELLDALARSMRLGFRTFASAGEFLAGFHDGHTGCALVDVRMPGMDGLELIDRLTARRATLPLIVVTAYADVPLAVRAMQAGAVDFLGKPCALAELRRSISRAIEIDAQRRRWYAASGQLDERLAQLTPDERQVLELMASGKPYKAIASELGVSLRTVHTRRARLMQKLQVANRVQLLELTLQARRLIPPGK